MERSSVPIPIIVVKHPSSSVFDHILPHETQVLMGLDGLTSYVCCLRAVFVGHTPMVSLHKSHVLLLQSPLLFMWGWIQTFTTFRYSIMAMENGPFIGDMFVARNLHSEFRIWDLPAPAMLADETRGYI